MSLLEITNPFRLKNEAFVKVLLKTLPGEYIRIVFDFFQSKRLFMSGDNGILSKEMEILILRGIIEEQKGYLELNEALEENLKGVFMANQQEDSEPLDCSWVEDYENQEDGYSNLLENIVACKKTGTGVSTFDIRSIIKHLRLVHENGITSTGFEFLLMTKCEQLWFLLLGSMDFFEMQEEEALGFLMNILAVENKTTKQISQDITVEENNILEFICSLGLIFMNQDYFYTNFGDIFEKEENQMKSHGFMVVETNYKIYSYTSKAYEKEVLSLFCRITLDVPGLVRGYLCERSVSNAFNKGITLDQLTKFIRNHVYKNTRVPENVLNQIRIWNDNRNRMKILPGLLFSEFNNYNDFMMLLQYTKSLDALIYASEEKRILFVRNECKEKIKEFFNKTQAES